MSYNLKRLKSKKIPDGSVITTYQIYKKNKRYITPKELHKLAEKLTKKNPNAEFNIKGHSDKIPKHLKDDDIMIRGLRPDRWSTLKNFGQDLSYQDEEDYLDGKVKDTTKFNKYFQVEITVIIPPKIIKKKSKNV
jgi:hypothetical protein